MYSRSALGSNRTFGSSTSRFAKKKLGQMAFPGRFKPVKAHAGSATARRGSSTSRRAYNAESDSDDEPNRVDFYDVVGEEDKYRYLGASSVFASRTRRILHHKPKDVPDPAAYDVPPGGIQSVSWHASDAWQVCVCVCVCIRMYSFACIHIPHVCVFLFNWQPNPTGLEHVHVRSA
jgi:hypothetical protein